ncbi:MAG: FAD-binding oxidoreductase, partial [Rhizobiales bacterium]|nr:FAD-binding oxidoreductase [Hyphomicrobiales bacterium]
LPAHCLESVLAHLPDARSPLTEDHAWHALVELVTEDRNSDHLDRLVEDIFESAMELGLVDDAVLASSETQAEDFWQLRDSISPAERAIGPAMQHDISVPVARMAEFVETASPSIEHRFPGTLAVGFGHLGDGNIHYHVLAPAGAVRGEWEESDGKAISAYVHDLVTEFGGS